MAKESKYRVKFNCTEHNHDDSVLQRHVSEDISDELRTLISIADIMQNEEKIRTIIENSIATLNKKKMEESIKTIFFPNKCWSAEAHDYVSVIYGSVQYAFRRKNQTAAADIISILENNTNGFHYQWFTNRNKDNEVDCVYWFSAIQKVSLMYK